MSQISPHAECLVYAEAFETLWAYFSQTFGKLYANETRESARLFVDSLRRLAVTDERVLDPVTLTLGEHTDVGDIVRRLADWADSSEPDSPSTPYETFGKSKFMLFGLLAGLKVLLLRHVELPAPPVLFSTREHDLSDRVVRWSGHLPRRALLQDPDAVVDNASKSLTIAIVGDVRRSQDLMTYAATSTDFADRMFQFIEKVRLLIEAHGGFFDKFTGDGFLAYFSQSISELCELQYMRGFIEFSSEILEFSSNHFADWSTTIRKRPAKTVGLALGADLGYITFADRDNHLLAVGDSIVWAARMASAAQAGEILVNNRLATELRRLDTLSVDDRPAETKAGEDFVAAKVSELPLSDASKSALAQLFPIPRRSRIG